MHDGRSRHAEKKLEDGLNPAEVRVLRAPCMGRCDAAPALELGHAHIEEATIEKVTEAIENNMVHPTIPEFQRFSDYVSSGGYDTLKRLRKSGDWKEVQTEILNAGLRGLGGADFPQGENGSLLEQMRAQDILPLMVMRASRVRSRTGTI